MEVRHSRLGVSEVVRVGVHASVVGIVRCFEVYYGNSRGRIRGRLSMRDRMNCIRWRWDVPAEDLAL